MLGPQALLAPQAPRLLLLGLPAPLALRAPLLPLPVLLGLLDPLEPELQGPPVLLGLRA